MSQASNTAKRQRIAARNREAIERWRGWIEGRIRDDVLRLHQQRVIWDGLEQVIHENDDLPSTSTLWEYLFDTYTAAQAAAIRRLTEWDDRQVRSLGQLLYQVGTGDQGTVTRAWWMSGWPQRWNRQAEGLALWESVAGPSSDEFPSLQARDDLARLETIATKVKNFTDRYLAHMDKRDLDIDDLPKVWELHEAIDLIRELYGDYSLLLTRTEDAKRDLSLSLENWREPLKRPWIA